MDMNEAKALARLTAEIPAKVKVANIVAIVAFIALVLILILH